MANRSMYLGLILLSNYALYNNATSGDKSNSRSNNFDQQLDMDDDATQNTDINSSNNSMLFSLPNEMLYHVIEQIVKNHIDEWKNVFRFDEVMNIINKDLMELRLSCRLFNDLIDSDRERINNKIIRALKDERFKYLVEEIRIHYNGLNEDQLNVSLQNILNKIQSEGRKEWIAEDQNDALSDHELLEEALKLIIIGAYVDSCDRVLGRTSLMWAVDIGRKWMVNFLIKSKANIYAKDFMETNILAIAAKSGNVDAFKIILDKMSVKKINSFLLKPNVRGYNALMFAAAGGNKDILKLILNHVNSDVINKIDDRNKECALTIAVKNRHVDCVRLLILAGANPNINNNRVFTEAASGSVDILKILLKANTNDIQQSINDVFTRAALMGNTEIIDFIINNSKDYSCDINSVMNKTLMLIAAEEKYDLPKNYLHVALLLINAGADIDAKNEDGDTALALALASGNTKMAKLLRYLKANVNIQSKNSDIALNAASSSSYKDVTNLFINNFNNDTWKNNHLMEARIRGNKEIAGACIKDDYVDASLLESAECSIRSVAKSFIKNFANIKIRNYIGENALVSAVKDGDEYIVKLLIKSGVNINFIDSTGDTALMLAIILGHIDIVKLLIKSGADINAKNNTGDTALMLATRLGYINIVKLLIKLDADINAIDNSGDTALMLAIMLGRIDIVKLFIQSGVDINFVNNTGHTALDLALRSDCADLVELFNNLNYDLDPEEL